jgi:hypothetical protein
MADLGISDTLDDIITVQDVDIVAMACCNKTTATCWTQRECDLVKNKVSNQNLAKTPVAMLKYPVLFKGGNTLHSGIMLSHRIS